MVTPQMLLPHSQSFSSLSHILAKARPTMFWTSTQLLLYKSQIMMQCLSCTLALYMCFSVVQLCPWHALSRSSYTYNYGNECCGLRSGTVRSIHTYMEQILMYQFHLGREVAVLTPGRRYITILAVGHSCVSVYCEKLRGLGTIEPCNLPSARV